MTNAGDLKVYIKEVGPGRWLAATGSAPYFCFEADSQEAVLGIAKRALQFYQGASKEIATELEAHRGRERAIPTFDSNNKISAKELVAA